MKTKNKKQESEYELSFLVDSYKKAEENLSLKKYQQVKVAIKELCYGCQPDRPFLSIRKICKAIAVSPVPVQRAITELIAEDVLYAKSGIGLFIKNPPVKNAATFSGHHTLRKIKELNFLYNDNSERNRTMMLDIVDKARRSNTELASVKLLFEADKISTPDIAIHFDSTSDFLDVSDFAWYDIQKNNLCVDGKYSIPLSFSTYYLFYNVEMLKDLGLDKPAYTNFSEQQEYIRTAKNILEKKKMLGPTSWNRPQYFLGNRNSEVLEFLKGEKDIDDQAGKDIFDLLSKIMDYYQLFTYEGAELRKSAFGAFLNFKTPLFAGNTNCLGQLEDLKGSKLKWEAYPIFTYDNTLPLNPIYATIDAKTHLPMESILFMTKLQKDDSQKIFCEYGHITVNRKGKYLPESPVFEEAAKKSWGGYLEESVDNYLFEHILDFKLIKHEARKGNIRETFEEIFHYSRGYMRNCN